jgi:hypothetical protein
MQVLSLIGVAYLLQLRERMTFTGRRERLINRKPELFQRASSVSALENGGFVSGWTTRNIPNIGIRAASIRKVEGETAFLQKQTSSMS